MRILTQQIELYRIHELSEKSKENAYYHWLQSSPYYWGNENCNVLNEFSKQFKISCYEYQYSAFHYHFNFRILEEVSADIECLRATRLATYIYNNYHIILYPFKTYYTVSNNTKRKSKITRMASPDLSQDTIPNMIYVSQSMNF